MWSETYALLTNRNIGILSEEQQEKLKNTRVAIAGLGGIGSPVVEMLCRLGIETFHVLDHGTFEMTNSNRQIYAFMDTVDRLKTDVTEEFLQKINPDVRVQKFTTIDSNSVMQFLTDVDIVVLGIDNVKPCLYISREARKRNIPLVEGWAVLYCNVRVFTPETPSLEEVYQMDTQNRDIDTITPEEEKQLLVHSLDMITRQIPGVLTYYPSSAMERIRKKNEGSTLAPVVWLTCSLMSVEVMKLILNWGKPALAPEFACYNPFLHEIPK